MDEQRCVPYQHFGSAGANPAAHAFRAATKESGGTITVDGGPPLAYARMDEARRVQLKKPEGSRRNLSQQGRPAP